MKVEIVCTARTTSYSNRASTEALEKRNILYAPDFVANAGGVINMYSELTGWTRERYSCAKPTKSSTLLGVYAIAKARAIPTNGRR